MRDDGIAGSCQQTQMLYDSWKLREREVIGWVVLAVELSEVEEREQEKCNQLVGALVW